MTQARFSIVSAVYEVAPYLPDFIDSMERQRIDHGLLEVVMVDDGSTDGSAELLRDWAERTDIDVQVIRQENAGQGAARNLGVQHARGEWISYADPDDFFHPSYFRSLARIIDQHPDVSMVAGNVILFDESLNRYRDDHPLRWRFADGDRVADLVEEPDCFQLFVSSAVFRTARVRDLGLDFDTRIRPNFEDGHFIARYLLAEERPTIAFAASARYFYRRRADQSSAIQTAWRRREKFTDLLRYGYLDLLTRATAGGEPAPGWLQSMIIYELGWYLRNEEALFGGATAADYGVEADYHDLMARITSLLDPERIDSYDGHSLNPGRRVVLAHGYSERPWREDTARLDQRDRRQRLIRVIYRYMGTAPQERLVLAGRAIEPHHAKHRWVTYSGRTLLCERILWITDDPAVELWLDGARVDIVERRPAPAEPRGVRGVVRSTVRLVTQGIDPHRRGIPGVLDGIRDRRLPERIATKARAVTGDRLDRLFLRRPDAHVFADCWLVMDRAQNARDSGEALFRYLRANRPDINAWFVLDEASPDWQRLEAELGGRLLAYGSRRWRMAALQARFIVSTHADAYVYQPSEFAGHARQPRWRFVFLQHGVIYNDLSRWLNFKPIAAMVTSTPAEYASIAGDRSPYRFTTKEIVRTGLPRFDRLRELAATQQADAIVIMPTWREFLLGKQRTGSTGRDLLADFASTDYARSWQAVLDDPALTRAANEHGLRVVFMPHPNIQPYLAEFRVPAHVRLGSYATDDVQTIIASARVLVTDYSSVAFDAAVLDRPTVYFQFDTDRVYSGEHITRRGYFDVERDGFGPVVSEAAEVSAKVAEMLAEPGSFAERRHRAFPGDLGSSCEAVLAAIEALDRPVPEPERTTLVPTPTMPARGATSG